MHLESKISDIITQLRIATASVEPILLGFGTATCICHHRANTKQQRLVNHLHYLKIKIKNVAKNKYLDIANIRDCRYEYMYVNCLHVECY